MVLHLEYSFFNPLRFKNSAKRFKGSQKNEVTFPEFCISAAAALTAVFFAARAGKEPTSMLPRLRDLQRMQLGPALDWMVSCLNLPK